MNRHISQFEHHEEEQNESQHHAARHQDALEFSSPDELLRYDASHTKLPPDIIHRLRESAPRKSWWQRLWARD